VDYRLWLLKALDAALPVTWRTGLRDGIIITPGGGAGRVLPLASMVVGHEVQAAALLDGDEPGRKEGRRSSASSGMTTASCSLGTSLPTAIRPAKLRTCFATTNS
jgi:hypothetical protein